MTKPIEGIAWPLRTDRLTLRPATAADAAATWQFRRIEEVARWLTSAPATLDNHRRDFTHPASLAKTLIVEKRGEVIGDLMLAVE